MEAKELKPAIWYPSEAVLLPEEAGAWLRCAPDTLDTMAVPHFYMSTGHKNKRYLAKKVMEWMENQTDKTMGYAA